MLLLVIFVNNVLLLYYFFKEKLLNMPLLLRFYCIPDSIYLNYLTKNSEIHENKRGISTWFLSSFKSGCSDDCCPKSAH